MRKMRTKEQRIQTKYVYFIYSQYNQLKPRRKYKVEVPDKDVVKKSLFSIFRICLYYPRNVLIIDSLFEANFII